MRTLYKPVAKRQVLYDSTYMRQLEESNSETDSRREVSRDWGEEVGMGSYRLTGRVSVLHSEKVLEGVAMAAQQCECNECP